MQTKIVEIDGQLVVVKICPPSKILAKFSLTKRKTIKAKAKGAIHCAREAGQFVSATPRIKK